MATVSFSCEQLWLFDTHGEKPKASSERPSGVSAMPEAVPQVVAISPESASTESASKTVAESAPKYLLLHSPDLPPVDPAKARASIIEQLSRKVRLVETGGRAAKDTPRISTGCEGLDRILPGGGYLPGSLVELVRPSVGSGASYLAFQTAREAMGATKQLVIVDTNRSFYPPAAAAMGVDLKRVVIVYPPTMADAIWALDQGLRCPAVGAVWSEIPVLDDQSARRLQLAAEQGGGLGLLIRDSRSRGGPSWAEVQWWVQPQSGRAVSGRAAGSDSCTDLSPSAQVLSAQSKWSQSGNRHLAVQLTRCRGGRSGAWVGLEIDAMRGQLREVPYHESQRVIGRTGAATGSVRLASELAVPTRSRHPVRAAAS